MKDPCFTPFDNFDDYAIVPKKLNNPFELKIPEICTIAVKEVQKYIQNNQFKWQHNFGLEPNKIGPMKGKMFGVLVVRNKKDEIGYLFTFSGKLNGLSHSECFVPSLFDIGSNDNFLSKGMTELAQIGLEIKQLEREENPIAISESEKLKKKRKAKSKKLQEELFDQYRFLSINGDSKSLHSIFKDYNNKKPVAGAGDCAAPKLFQYAFQREMKPLAIAEFWWGASTRGDDKKHGEYYPACQDKCKPILTYMLS